MTLATYSARADGWTSSDREVRDVVSTHDPLLAQAPATWWPECACARCVGGRAF